MNATKTLYITFATVQADRPDFTRTWLENTIYLNNCSIHQRNIRREGCQAAVVCGQLDEIEQLGRVEGLTVMHVKTYVVEG